MVTNSDKSSFFQSKSTHLKKVVAESLVSLERWSGSVKASPLRMSDAAVRKEVILLGGPNKSLVVESL